MNTDSIRRMVKGLGKGDFDRLVAVIVKDVFKLVPLNIDGRGDCGTDIALFGDGIERKIAIQVTVQQKGWQEKIIGDAGKVSVRIGKVRFYAMVNVEPEESEKIRVADEIFDRYSISAQVYTVREIASLIEEKGLEDKLRDIVSPDWRTSSRVGETDMAERLLHSYFVMSDSGAEVQNEIYDSTILFVVGGKGCVARLDVIIKVAEMLMLSDEEKEKMERRIDSLMSRDLLENSESGLSLSERATKEVGIATSSYAQDIKAFSDVCRTVIVSHGGSADAEVGEELAGCVARCYLKRLIEDLRKSSLAFRISGFDRTLTDAEELIKDLLGKCGIGQNEDRETIRNEIVDKAGSCELVRKMLSAVVYVCLRDVSSTRICSVLNVSSWEDVVVYIDASVAIPYLASKEFGASAHRYSAGALAIMKACFKLRVRRCLPREYLNECAAHLITAYDLFCVPYSDFESDLAYSQNGFVAHYYQRKKQNDERFPASLSEYIGRLSHAAIDSTIEYKKRVAVVENDLKAFFAEYGVEVFEDEEDLTADEEKDISIELSQILKNRARVRGDTQIRHDVWVAGKLARHESRLGLGKVLLTWDSALMELVPRINSDCWVVNPIVASDIIQARYRLPDANYLSLGIALAKTRNRRDDVAGRFVDRMLELCGEKLLNSQYRDRLQVLKGQLVEQSVKMSDEEIDAQIDRVLGGYDRDLARRIEEKRSGCPE